MGDRIMVARGGMIDDQGLVLESAMSGVGTAAGRKRGHIEMETETKVVSETARRTLEQIKTERELAEEKEIGAEVEIGIEGQKVCIVYYRFYNSIEAYWP